MVAIRNGHQQDNSTQRLLQGMSDLEEMSECHGFALRALSALRYLSHRWGIETSPDTPRHQDISDMSHETSAVEDQFYPDVNILQTLQSIQPILSSKDPQLFSSFPTHGLPILGLGFIA